MLRLLHLVTTTLLLGSCVSNKPASYLVRTVRDRSQVE